MEKNLCCLRLPSAEVKTSKPMVCQNKSIDKKANELDLSLLRERRPAYGLCSPPLPDGYSNLKPEWLNVPDAARVSGLGRSTFELSSPDPKTGSCQHSMHRGGGNNRRPNRFFYPLFYRGASTTLGGSCNHSKQTLHGSTHGLSPIQPTTNHANK